MRSYNGAPAGVLDGGTGCPLLAATVRRIQPAIHCIGHVHEYRGRISGDTNYFNWAATPFTFPVARVLRCAL
jgi:Icc-related predicted phosphoesterase